MIQRLNRPSTFMAMISALMTAASLALAGPAWAQGDPQEISLNAQQRALVQKVEAYLNGITTLQSRFFQQTSTNEFAEGEILLSRPGRLRIEYKPPNPVMIIAKGEFLSYIDKELKNVTYIPVEDTPAAFLLNGKISLDPARVAFHEVAQEDGAIYVTVAERGEPFAGRLTLIFRANPMTLRKWSVIDAQGTITDIVLTDPFYGGQIDPKQFEFVEYERERSAD